jgi:hypothetical protein
MPYWLLASLSGIFAALLWIHKVRLSRKFSLSTLLIVVTVSALLMGLIAYLAR